MRRNAAPAFDPEAFLTRIDGVRPDQITKESYG